MRHLTEKIVCCITAAAALLFCMAGCRAKLLMAETQEQCGTPTGKTTFKTEKPAQTTTAAETTKGEFPASGTVNGIGYNLTTSSTSGDGSAEKGYYLFQSEKDEAYPYKVLIAMGERSTGGYDISITDIEYDGSCMTITVKETNPPKDAMVTEAITYPTCAVELSGLPLSMKVKSEGGYEYKCLLTRIEPTKTDSEKGGKLIASFCDGYGEIMYKTCVYELSDGRYRIENIKSVTEHWGATKWIDKVCGTAVVTTREEVVEEAKKFGSCGYVIYPGDYKKPHTPAEFLAKKQLQQPVRISREK